MSIQQKKRELAAFKFIEQHKKKIDYVSGTGKIYGHVKTYLKTAEAGIIKDSAKLKQIFPGIKIIKHPDERNRKVVDVYATYYDFYPSACGKCLNDIRTLPIHVHKTPKGVSIFICEKCWRLENEK